MTTILHKYFELLNEDMAIKAATEADTAKKRKRREDLEYKEDKTKGVITKVTTALKGTESATATKLAKRFFTMKKAVDKLTAAQKDINEQLTEKAINLFDEATDSLVTRVVKTGEFVISIAKDTEPTEQKKVDYEALYNDLTKLIDASLIPQLDSLLEKHTKKWMPEKKKPATTVKPIEEGIVSAATNKLASMVQYIEVGLSTFLSALKKWGKGYDQELAALKRRAKAKPVTEGAEPLTKDSIIAAITSAVESKGSKIKSSKDMTFDGGVKGTEISLAVDLEIRAEGEWMWVNTIKLVENGSKINLMIVGSDCWYEDTVESLKDVSAAMRKLRAEKY